MKSGSDSRFRGRRLWCCHSAVRACALSTAITRPIRSIPRSPNCYLLAPTSTVTSTALGRYGLQNAAQWTSPKSGSGCPPILSRSGLAPLRIERDSGDRHDAGVARFLNDSPHGGRYRRRSEAGESGTASRGCSKRGQLGISCRSSESATCLRSSGSRRRCRRGQRHFGTGIDRSRWVNAWRRRASPSSRHRRARS